MGRMGSRYEDVLAKRAADLALPTDLHGSSGYFSRPTPDLDPRLFPPGSDQLHPEVRRWILSTLYNFWESKYHHPHWWSTVWIAGSGITHQWSGGRAVADQPGDLDVLIGVDFPTFFHANPSWQGTPDGVMTEHFNEEFHAELWPQTANAVLPSGGAPFEVTFYVNPNSADIRNINPYAAYNVSGSRWTVHPAELPEDWDPRTHFSQQWWDHVNDEANTAVSLLAEFRGHQERARLHAPGSGGWLNTMNAMHDTLRRARILYSGIHNQRQLAFSPGGGGYGDYYNFRWQAHKHLGTAQALHQLAALDAEVHRDLAAQCGGGPLDHTHALVLASKASLHG